MGWDKISTDNVDELKYIRLSWNRHGEREGMLETGKIFQLCPIDLVRCIIHIVTGHDMFAILHKTVSYKSG